MMEKYFKQIYLVLEINYSFESVFRRALKKPEYFNLKIIDLQDKL